MKIELIKKINEKTPYFIKRPFARFIRKKLINNSVFASTYAELESFEHLSEEEKKKIQLNKLKEMLDYAYSKSAFYHTLFDERGFNPEKLTKIEDLQVLPVLKKSTLQQCLKEISVDEIDNAYLVTTGGTTGKPTKVWMEKNAIYKEWAFVYYYWAKFGYDFSCSKLATFRGVNLGGKISEINPLYAEIRLNPFLLNENNIKQYIKKMDDYGADFIYGYPSSIYNFCRIAKTNNIDLKNRFKAAFLISENLYDFQESMITEVLNCEIAMFYGHSERAVFGERIGQHYIFNPLYGVTEVSPNGEPIVTGFINRKTPLIRYVVDDELQVVDDGKYDIRGHHNSDVLMGLNGEQIAAASINFHDDTMHGVATYQFEQNEKGKCLLKILPKKNYTDIDLNKIKRHVQKKLGSAVECNVMLTDELTLTARGKYQMIVQNIPSEMGGIK